MLSSFEPSSIGSIEFNNVVFSRVSSGWQVVFTLRTLLQHPKAPVLTTAFHTATQLDYSIMNYEIKLKVISIVGLTTKAVSSAPTAIKSLPVL
jgi:hypothetical protein